MSTESMAKLTAHLTKEYEKRLRQEAKMRWNESNFERHAEHRKKHWEDWYWGQQKYLQEEREKQERRREERRKRREEREEKRKREEKEKNEEKRKREEKEKRREKRENMSEEKEERKLESFIKRECEEKGTVLAKSHCFTTNANLELSLPIGVSSFLKEFEDVLPKDIPKGLPPLRGIEKPMDLIPSASLSKLHESCFSLTFVGIDSLIELHDSCHSIGFVRNNKDLHVYLFDGLITTHFLVAPIHANSLLIPYEVPNMFDNIILIQKEPSFVCIEEDINVAQNDIICLQEQSDISFVTKIKPRKVNMVVGASLKRYNLLTTLALEMYGLILLVGDELPSIVATFDGNIRFVFDPGGWVCHTKGIKKGFPTQGKSKVHTTINGPLQVVGQ